MPKNARLYLVFTATFLVMHFTGVLVSGLPYIINGLITSAIVITTLVSLLAWNSHESLENIISSIGFRKANVKAILPGMVISVVLLFSYLLLGLGLAAKVYLAKDWYLNLAGLFLTGGLTEEMLFRGYLFDRVRRNRSFRNASLISAVLFSAVHLVMFAYMDWPVALLSTMLAVASAVPLAFLYEYGNRTIWSPALVHTAIRTIGLVVTTDEAHFMQFSLLWIVSAMVIPYTVLIFYKEFRSSWKKGN